MEPATASNSRSGSSGVVVAVRDWSRLPEDLLVCVLGSLHVADIIRSGAVFGSWHAAYVAFRRLRLPSPRQPPCLLYASADIATDEAALHCLATGATLRIPFPLAPLRRRPLLGSGHGWLVTADEVSNLHLINPITGDQVALPPITALHHVENGTDEHGDPAYLVYENLHGQYNNPAKPTILELDQAHLYMYYRVTLSASSSSAPCVVLLLHMPHGEISFARIGDERWTWVAPENCAGLPWRFFYVDAMYNDVDGLFYVLGSDASVYSLDLHGPTPVASTVVVLGDDDVPNNKSAANHDKYLVQAPQGGDILQVWRRRTYVDLPTPVVLPPDYDDDGDMCHDPYSELVTTDVQLYRVHLHGQTRLEMIKSLPDCALFLGLNGSMCLPVKDFPGLKPDCAYVTDDFLEYVNMMKYNPREVGIWSMAEQSMSRLVDVSPIVYPWLTWPSPIWIEPSFF